LVWGRHNACCSPRHQQPIPLLFFGGGDETLDDGSRYNPAVISFIRDEWLHNQVKEREPEYTEYRALRLFVGSWNVNGKVPKEDISAWLCEGASADAEGRLDLPDIYVIGCVCPVATDSLTRQRPPTPPFPSHSARGLPPGCKRWWT